MLDTTDNKSEYVKAVLEGRFATASYLFDYLEPALLENFLIAPPGWDRQIYQVKGEINKT